jgi:hypothetical protein
LFVFFSSFVSTTEKLFLTCLLVMVFLAGSWLMCGGGTTAASPIGAYLLVSALAGTVMGLLGYTFHEEVFGSF